MNDDSLPSRGCFHNFYTEKSVILLVAIRHQLNELRKLNERDWRVKIERNLPFSTFKAHDSNYSDDVRGSLFTLNRSMTFCLQLFDLSLGPLVFNIYVIFSTTTESRNQKRLKQCQ